MVGQQSASRKYHQQPKIMGKTQKSWTTRRWNRQKLKQVSLFRSCTLCVQGSAQKQDVAEPPGCGRATVPRPKPRP